MNKKLEWWQKFPNLDREVLNTLRSMLRLRDDEELPEVLWVVMGIHRAMECRFGSHPWGWRDLASMVIETQAFVPAMQNRTKWVAGAMVRVKSMNIDAAYWHPGPLNLHLVNAYGDVYLVEADDIEAPPSSDRESEMSQHAVLGAGLQNVVTSEFDTTLVGALTGEELEPAKV